ncbi:MAG: organic hydroperoxide resistance protein [Paracoccus sp. (in: a-proteobacteria)]|nr:organic hydroperoxide resistance protein [Paracoccus sp. (in: a-proteobacteria)]
MTPEKILYSAEMTATGGRDGQARRADGSLSLKLTMPKELGGPGGEGTNPEELFAAGYAGCFLSALKAVGRQAKIAVPDDASVRATVGIGPVPTGFGLAVRLAVSLPGLSDQDARALMEKAHQVCPYSNATRGNIDVTLSLA